MVLPVALGAAAANSAAIANIIGVAKQVFDVVRTGVAKVDARQQNSTLSLIGYTRQTTLRSRVYIDSSLIDEEVIPKIVRAVHTMYAGLILNALHLNQFVTQGKTVQDLLGTVSTEAFVPYHNVSADIAGLAASLESVKDNKHCKIAAFESLDSTTVEDSEDTKTKKSEDFKTSDVTVAPPTIAPVGKILEVELTNPDNPKASAKLMLTVQMIPYLIPAGMASAFINKDTSLSFRNRVLMWRAGEISFWRDLLLNVDRTNRSYELSKNDPNKVFYEFMANVAKKDRASISKNLIQLSANKSHNLANSVMIFSSEAVARARVESGIDLHDSGVRSRYFRDTYAMMIVVVDPMYNQVTLYMNGIDDVGTYTFAQFDHKSADKDNGIDLLKIMSMLTGGKAPRF